ncbi:peroxiredoxin-2E-1, chloroplastic-like [Phoenix dactylifera]|uniref:glutaredoxin-dependent peroxiredoxin n=1 Tax=Phoenix dactylifera TaxID=42345 RepID=A0A8B7BPE9_PHODC|nr:peroxiredoxin-2E-1, chloroplastic-like [Phoenix dactylifera]
MAASVNNIAATFAAARDFPPSSSSSPPPPSSSSSPAATSTAAFSASLSTTPARPIFASWNPQSSLPRSHRSSLLSLYGLPGPRPHPLLRPPRAAVVAPSSATVSVGDRLPDAALSYLDRGGAVRTVSLAELTRAGKAVIMAVPGAFALPPRPRWGRRGGGSGAAIRLSPERLVKKAVDMRAKGRCAAGTVLVACVAANDVYVMRAWGEQLGAAEGGVMMLSDPDAQMATALGMALDLRGGVEGFGVRSEGYVIVAVNGMVRALFLNHYDGGAGDSATGLDDVLRRL